MKKIAILLAILLALPSALAISRTCTRAIDPPKVDQDMRLCADNYYPHNYPQGISIAADGVTFDCGTGVLHGKFKNSGIVIENRKGVTLKNCQIANYETGILIKNSRDITILDSKFIRNHVGIKLIDSTGVIVEQSYDISIKKPVQAINSAGNTFHFVNKDFEGDLCRLNQCNTPSGVGAREYSLSKAEEPKKALRRLLNDNIRAWLSMA